MATGWGMHNNIGGLLAMMIPFPFYLAYTRKNCWLYIGLASVLMLGVIISCSRTAMLVGALEFVFCSILLLRKPEKRKPILIVCGTAAVAVTIFAILSFDTLMNVYALFIDEIDAISKRDLLFINGMKQFRQYPIFGGTFFPQGEYVPWDWAELEAFSSFFPPRWHNTLVQIAASCGIVGLAAYVIHRIQTVRLFLRHRNTENLFIAIYIVALLVAGLLDNHFFNVGPVLVYSMALAFAENIDQSKV
jgi:O-antigen ligase